MPNNDELQLARIHALRLTRRSLLGGGAAAIAATAWGPGWRGQAQNTGPELLIAAVDATPSERAAANYLCDGVDDYIQGRQALAALPLSGGTLRFSSGHFNFGEHNIIYHNRPNITSQGAGMDVTFISNNTDLPYDSEPLSYTRCDGAIVRDMTLHGAGAVRTTADTLDFDDSDDCLVERVRITGARGRGIVFDGKDPGGTSFRNVIRDCIITGCTTDGIQLLCTNHCQVINTICNFNGTTSQNSAYGIRIQHSVAANQASNNNTVIGGECVGNRTSGIGIHDGDGNIIDGTYIADNRSDGISVSSSDITSMTTNNTIIRNCTITDTRSPSTAKTQRWGINLNGLPPADISNTQILSNNLCGNRSGALLNNATNTIAQGNACGPTLNGGPTPTPTSTATSAQVSGYLSDNFETGNLERWTTVTNFSIQAGSAHGGAFGARAQSTGNAAYIRSPLTQTVTDVWAGIRFKLDNFTGSDISIMRLRTASNLSIMGVHVTSARTLDIRNDIAQVSRHSTQSVSLGAWHTIEIHVVITGATGRVETWLDGIRVDALCRTENFGSSPAGIFQVGESVSGRTFTLHVDDVTVKDQCVFTCPASATPTATNTATAEPTTTAIETKSPVPGAAYFYDDFETGSLERWSSVANCAVSSTSAYQGVYGARGQTSGSPTYLRGPLSQPVTQAWASMRFRLDSRSGLDMSLMRLRSTSNLSIAGLHVNAAGKLEVRNDLAAVSRRSSQVVSLGGWHTVEMRLRIAGASGEVDVWLDGARIESLCGPDNLGSTAIGSVQVGDSSSGRTFSISVDNVSVHDQCVFSCPAGAITTPTNTATASPTKTETATPTRTASNVPPSATPSTTSVPSTATPTITPVPPTPTYTNTPTDTPVPPTPTYTNTPVPPTSTPAPYAFGFEILSAVPPPSGGTVDVRVTLLSGSVPVNVNLRSSSANHAIESPDWYRFTAVGEAIVATLTDQVGPSAPGGTTRLQMVVNNGVVAQTDPIPFPAG